MSIVTVETLAARLDAHLVECLEDNRSAVEERRLLRLDVATTRATVEATSARQKVFVDKYDKVFDGYEDFVAQWTSVKRGLMWLLGAILTGVIALGVTVYTRPGPPVYTAQDAARDLASHDAAIIKAIREAKP